MRRFFARLLRRTTAEPQVGISPPPESRPASGVEELFEDVAARVTARFDPALHTVPEVKAYLAAHPEDRTRVIRAERRGKARKTILGD